MLLFDKIKFVERAFGPGKLDGAGINFAVRCPVLECQSRAKGTKKLVIKLDDDLNHCWVCGHRAKSLLPLLKRYEPSMLMEYLERFAPRLNNWKSSVHAIHHEEDVVAYLPKDFKLLATHLDSINPSIKRAINYIFRDRGLDESDLWFYKFGISNEPEFQRRVIMPSFDAYGTLNFFTARSLDEKPYIKYLNCTADKKDVVFNEINVDWTKPLTIVEGPFDMTKAGDNVTCLQGSELSDDSRIFQQIVMHKTPVILALDSDMPLKQQEFGKRLQQRDIDVSLVDLAGYHDPGSMTKEQFKQICKNAKPWGWESYIFKKLNIWASSSFRI